MTQNPEAITKGDPFKYIKTPHGKKKKRYCLMQSVKAKDKAAVKSVCHSAHRGFLLLIQRKADLQDRKEKWAQI